MSVIVYGAPKLAPPPRVQPFQVIINGHAFAGNDESVPDDAGVYWAFRDLEGWWSPSGSTGESAQRSYQDGAWLSPAYHAGRTLVLRGTLYGNNRAAVMAALERFLGGLSIRDLTPLVVVEDGLTRHTLVRREGEPLVEWRGGKAARFNVQFSAPDYRRLSGDGTAPTHIMETGLPTQSGGLAFPVRFPATFDADIVTGIIPITNIGTAPPPVTVNIHGPGSGPVIRSGDGRSMPFDITLDAGQFLEVDFDRKTVKLNAQASRRGAMRGRWITLAPGPNVLMFDAASYNPGTRFTVAWYDAWK